MPNRSTRTFPPDAESTMPQRRSTRGLLVGGIVLVASAVACTVLPHVWERDHLIRRLQRARAAIVRLETQSRTVVEVVDSLRDARSSALEFVLTGARAARVAFGGATARVRPLLALEAASGAALGVPATFSADSRDLLGILRGAMASQANADGSRQGTGALLDRSRYLIQALDRARNRDLAAIDQQVLAILAQESVAARRHDRRAVVAYGVAGVALGLGLLALALYRRRILLVDAQIRVSRDTALEASMTKSRFVAIVSHDLRQPLHAISMFVGVLRRRVNDAALHKVLDNLDSAVASMQRMFATLLDVARLDANAIQVGRQNVPLQPLFETLANEFGGSTVAKGLTLRLHPTWLSVRADPALLETILRNLLSNAVKFTEEGRIDVAAWQEKGAVAIEVRDTGIGIPTADHHRIFGQFERGGEGARGREGLGLGLSIVLRMANMIDAGIRVDSEPGRGSSFVVTLPPAANTAVAPCVRNTGTVRVLLGRQILVLDPHQAGRHALALAIESMGAHPLEAGTTEAAFALLSASALGEPVAAVIDQELGAETAGDFLRRFAEARGRALPAVIVSAATDGRALKNLAAAGCPWLLKPVSPEVLLSLLTQVIESDGPRPTPTDHG